MTAVVIIPARAIKAAAIAIHERITHECGAPEHVIARMVKMGLAYYVGGAPFLTPAGEKLLPRRA